MRVPNKKLSASLVIALALAAHGAATTDTALQRAVDGAFTNGSGAALVVRVSDGRVLAAHNTAVLARRVAAPGSAIKPFVLELMLESGAIRADEQLMCRRNLRIAGHSLQCSHPAELSSFRAEDALAFSCNFYFATAAARLEPGALERRFHELGF